MAVVKATAKSASLPGSVKSEWLKKDLQLFFKEGIELQKLFNRRDDADSIGFEFGESQQHFVVMVDDLGEKVFVIFYRLLDRDSLFHIEDDLRAALLHGNDAQDSRKHTCVVEISNPTFCISTSSCLVITRPMNLFSVFAMAFNTS